MVQRFGVLWSSANPPVDLTMEDVKVALIAKYEHTEDPNKVWHAIQGLVQGEGETIDRYVKKFSAMWEKMCKALSLSNLP